MTRNIQGLVCAEPNREGEYPIAHVVGYDGVTDIYEVELSGFPFYDVYKGAFKAYRLSGLHVVQVEYREIL